MSVLAASRLLRHPNSRVQVGLSDPQFQALEALAAEAGEAMSQYIRRVLADHLAWKQRVKRGR